MIVDGDVGSISDGRFDGVLWCRPDFGEASLDSIQNASVPVVMMHVPPGMAYGVPTFCADNDGAMRLVVEHLTSLGHERLAFVIDPISVHTVEGKARCQAFLNSAKLADLPVPEVIVLEQDHSILGRYAASDRPHTALVCFSDELAGYVLSSCDRLGVSVPHHVSVVGFDSSPFCETTTPRLTSVSQPVARIAQEATNHLLLLVHEADAGLPRSPMASCIYDCGLDIRESTSSPCTH
jgi:LacI family transcriptional regulator